MEEALTLQNLAMGQIMNATSTQELESIRIEYLGKNGRLSALIKQISKLPKEDRGQAGFIVNQAKKTITDALQDANKNLSSQNKIFFDPTIPGIKPPVGHLHLLTQTMREIETIFRRLGFVRRRYMEVEWDWYSFTSLNFPKNHPAWDTLETFFVDAKPDPKLGEMILTPHTSNGQVREMQRNNPAHAGPIRMINIGKTYRRQTDLTHTPMFHQFEGLVVDKNISITNLVGTLDYFAKEFFGPERSVRLRPHNFRFTEPSFEVDISCDICSGQGCKVCKGGWLELGGSGMVHPNVLKAGGIDPDQYSGFAFGWGVERVTMMKTGINIPDLRVLYSTDIDYLTQF